MPDYLRETRTTTLRELPASMATALSEHTAGAQLTVAPDAPVFLTRNVRQGRRRLLGPRDPDPEHLVALVIGHRDLLVCVHGEKRGTAVLGCRLDGATVASVPLPVAGETGVSITGFASTDGDGRPAAGSFYVGLGDPDGETARTVLTEAVRVAKAR